MNLPPRWRVLLVLAACIVVAGLVVFHRQRFAAMLGSRSAEADSEEAVADAFVGAAFSPDASEEDLRQSAVDVASALVQALPAAPDALNVQARVLLSLGDSTQAMALWCRCVQLDPSFSDAHYGLGYAAKEKGQYEQALEMFRRVTALDPSDTRAPILLGECLLKLGRFEEAAGELERCLKKGTPTAAGMVALGHAYLELGRVEMARQAFEAAAHDVPEDKAAHYGLGTVYSRLGQTEKARQHLEQFRKLSVSSKEKYVSRMRTFGNYTSMRDLAVETHVEAGRVWMKHGDADRAEDLWRRAAALSPTDAGCRKELAALYERTGRNRQALRICGQLRQLEPGNADYCLSIGVLNARLDRFDAARAAIEEAVQLDPQNPRYREAYEAMRQAQKSP